MPALSQNAFRYRWLIFLVLSSGYVLVIFHRLCPAVLAVDMMHDLGAGGTLLGLLGAAYFYPYTLMQIPAGLLADSWGARKSITLFFCLAFVGSILLAAAPDPFVAIIGRTLVGLGVSVFFVPTLKILAEWFRPQEFALMTGILLAVGGLGMLSAAGPLSLLNSWIGWRSSFLAVGLMTLAIVLLVWRFVRDRPADLGLDPPWRPEQAASRPLGLLEGVRNVASHPGFWPTALWFFCTSGVFFSFGGLWGGPYLMQIYKFDGPQTGQILSMPALAMILGSPALSYLSDHVIRARKPIIVATSVLLLGLTALLAFRTDRLSTSEIYLLCLGLGISCNAVAVLAFALTKELFPVQIAGTSTGLLNLFPFAGAALLQPLLGAILESHGRIEGSFTLEGYEQAFLVLFVSAFVALVSSLFMRETLGRTRGHT